MPLIQSSPKHDISYSMRLKKPPVLQLIESTRFLKSLTCQVLPKKYSRFTPDEFLFQSSLISITVSGNLEVFKSSMTLPLTLSLYLITKVWEFSLWPWHHFNPVFDFYRYSGTAQLNLSDFLPSLLQINILTDLWAFSSSFFYFLNLATPKIFQKTPQISLSFFPTASVIYRIRSQFL